MIKEVSTAINLPHLKKKKCRFLFFFPLSFRYVLPTIGDEKKKKRESTPSERNKHTHTHTKKKKRAIQQARLHKSAQRHTIKQCQFQRPSKQKQKCFQNSLLIKKKEKQTCETSCTTAITTNHNSEKRYEGRKKKLTYDNTKRKGSIGFLLLLSFLPAPTRDGDALPASLSRL